MIKKILTITSITVLATFIMTMAMVNVAQAGLPLTLDTADFKCDKVFGSFYPPPATGPLLFSSAWGDCSLLGQAGLTSVTGFAAGPVSEDNCILLETPAGLDGFAINEKGNIRFSLAVEQCFFDSDGAALAGLPPGFCGSATHAFTSTVTGTYLMTGGRILMRSVIPGGMGAVSSAVDHCNGNIAPFANSVKTTLTGDIILGE